MKAESYTLNGETGTDLYELAVTNEEVQTFYKDTAGEVLSRLYAGDGRGGGGSLYYYIQPEEWFWKI